MKPKKRRLAIENRISPNATINRTHLMSHNLDEIKKAMKQSGIRNPVGIIVDATDRIGGALYLAVLKKSGLSEGEAVMRKDAMIAELQDRGQFPSVILAAAWEQASGFLSCTSPTAKENLLKLKTELDLGNGNRFLIVAIANGGNMYCILDIPEMSASDVAVEDAPHRHGGIHILNRK